MALTHEYLLPFALPGAQAGQAGNITASILDSGGAVLNSQPAYNIREVGSGFYFYTTTAMPDGLLGAVRIIFGGATVGVGAVAPRESEYAGAILGLSGENVVQDDVTFDAAGSGVWVSANQYHYDTAAHATAHVLGGGAGQTGNTRVYHVTRQLASQAPILTKSTRTS